MLLDIRDIDDRVSDNNAYHISYSSSMLHLTVFAPRYRPAERYGMQGTKHFP